ncbi:MAG: PAS domain S-box protein [Chloroflexaceae bacterium]
MSDEHATTNGLQTQCAELQAENQHLRRQLTQLRQEQERLKYALEGSKDGTWDWLIRENQAVLSDRYREMLGYSPDELPDSVDSWLNSIHPDDMPIITQTVEEHLAGKREEYIVEHRLRHKSGEWRWMLSRGKIVARDESGQPLRMTGTISDITERKQQEAELHQFKALIENAPNGFIMADMNGMITYANPAYYQCVGWDRSLLGHPVITNLDEAPEHVDDLMQQVMAEGNWQGELRYRRKDGSTFSGQAGSFIVYDSHGQPQAIAGIMRDITKQKQAETMMQRLVALVENSNDFIGIAGLDGQVLYINRAGQQMVGVDAESDIAHMQVSDCLQPEDTDYVFAHIIPTVMRDGRWAGEFRFRNMQTGASIPVHYTVFTVKDPQSDAVLGLGTVTRDITEQKRIEQDMQRLVAIVENSLDFVATASFEGAPVYISPAGLAMVGLENMEQARQYNVIDFYPAADRPVFDQEIMPAMTRDGFWQGEFRFRNMQTDAPIPVHFTVFLVKDPATGTPLGIGTVTRDITEQKRQEAERATLQQRVIDAQRNALRELSTPLIPISDDVVIMPLIGTIDSQRARQVMETLLTGVAHHQASLAILDITGVSVVDTQVAQAFIQAAQAVKLLGAQVMLTGIQPQIAQTLVHLGVDLRGIQTRSSLQAGIAAAL